MGYMILKIDKDHHASEIVKGRLREDLRKSQPAAN